MIINSLLTARVQQKSAELVVKPAQVISAGTFSDPARALPLTGCLEVLRCQVVQQGIECYCIHDHGAELLDKI